MPAAKPDRSSVVAALDQEKVYGAEAPLTVRFIEPLTAPQLALTVADEIETAEEPVTVIEDVEKQLLALVTVTMYVPAARAEISSVVAPLLQENV